MGRGGPSVGPGADAVGITLDPVIRELMNERLRRGWSQSETARRAGIQPSLISTAERGVHNTQLNIVHAWAGAFGLILCVASEDDARYGF